MAHGLLSQRGMPHVAKARPRAVPPDPRERLFEAGVDALGDAELIALLLGTGGAGQPVGVVAADVLARHGGLCGLARAGVGELAVSGGVGVAKAARIAAAVELGRRVGCESARQPVTRFGDAHAVDAWARPRIATLDHEELWVIAVDGRNALRAARRVGVGGLHGLSVSTRDPLRCAVREAASAFVLVHNHPSGDATPSDEDIAFTRRLAEAASLVGTPLLDHVIVARGGFTSLLESAAIASGLAPVSTDQPAASVGRSPGRRATSKPLRGASSSGSLRDENLAMSPPNSTASVPPRRRP
jgi:DNA repair protein RadC